MLNENCRLSTSDRVGLPGGCSTQSPHVNNPPILTTSAVSCGSEVSTHTRTLLRFVEDVCMVERPGKLPHLSHVLIRSAPRHQW